MTWLTDILFTAPHSAVELAALIFCWAVALVAGWVALQLAIVLVWGLGLVVLATWKVLLVVAVALGAMIAYGMTGEPIIERCTMDRHTNKIVCYQTARPSWRSAEFIAEWERKRAERGWQ